MKLTKDWYNLLLLLVMLIGFTAGYILGNAMSQKQINELKAENAGLKSIKTLLIEERNKDCPIISKMLYIEQNINENGDEL